MELTRRQIRAMVGNDPIKRAECRGAFDKEGVPFKTSAFIKRIEGKGDVEEVHPRMVSERTQ
jgi:hypothetical protein